MSNTQLVTPNDNSKIPDLLHLANIYAHGLGKLWKTKSEATKVLAITYPNIRRHHLSAAESLAQLPMEILELFKDVGLGTWAWRCLTHAKKKHGITSLLKTAQEIRMMEKNFSRAEIIGMLSLTGYPYPDAPLHFSPSKISAAYERGVKEGRWSTFHGAGEVLGLDRGAIAVALQFLTLPKHVTRLFDSKAITYDNCRVILEIEKVYGRAALVQRARSISKDAQDLKTPDDIIGQIIGMAHQSAAVIPRIKIPRNKRKVVFEFHCEDPRFLMDRSNELLKLVETGFISYLDAAIASIGATPRMPRK